MADCEFGEVRREFLEMSVIIERDGELGEQGEGGADGTFGADIVPTEKAVRGKLCLKLEVDKGGDSGPKRGSGRFRVEEGVVARNHDALSGHLVLQIDDGQVIVRVVVVGSGFASETHAG